MNWYITFHCCSPMQNHQSRETAPSSMLLILSSSSGMVPVCRDEPPSSLLWDAAGSGRPCHWSMWWPCMGLLSCLSLAVEPDLITFLESRQIDQVVVVDFHLVPGHLQVLTGIVMYVMELFNEVSSIVSCWLPIVGGRHPQEATRQAECPPEHHVSRGHACGLVGRCSVG
jgi:hypothetical protein